MNYIFDLRDQKMIDWVFDTDWTGEQETGELNMSIYIHSHTPMAASYHPIQGSMSRKDTLTCGQEDQMWTPEFHQSTCQFSGFPIDVMSWLQGFKSHAVQHWCRVISAQSQWMYQLLAGCFTVCCCLLVVRWRTAASFLQTARCHCSTIMIIIIAHTIYW